MKLLHDALANHCFALDLDAQSMPAIFEQVVRHLVEKKLISSDRADRSRRGLC